MLNRSTSLFSLATLNPDGELYRDDYEDGPQQLPVGQAEARSSLCTRCQNFDLLSFTKSADRRKGYLLRDVKTAAAHGCQFCGLLLDALEDVEEPEYFHTNAFVGKTILQPELYVHMTISENYEAATSTTASGGLRVNRLFVELGDRFSGMRNSSNHEICIAADPESPAALSGDVLGRYLGDDPSSHSHLETIGHWLRACNAHPKCSQTVSGSVRIDASNSPLPTRVIEVVRENGQQRLYLRHTDGLHGSYITLTHRWNEHTSMCITTTSNIESRVLGDDFGELPLLFRDAFTIAEKLGIGYLWIDSICIIQRGDDLADWRREAPKMAQYYQFSIFTLAGTAEDVTDGILQPYSRDVTPWSSKLVRLPYRNGANVVSGSFYCYKRRHPLFKEYMEEVRGSILLRRGWILQEWLLSKRLLWYTPRGLFFECQQEPPHAYDQSQLAISRASPDLQTHLQLKESFHFSNHNILDFWYSVLEVYSGQQLTKPELDRILAVAGLAQEVGPILANAKRVEKLQKAVQDEVYIAGLWLRDIHRGLLWEQHHNATPCTGKVEQAPSWSWASMLIRVCWPAESKGTISQLEVIGMCFQRWERHTTPDYLVFGGCNIRSHDATIEVPRFDPINLFSCLHVHGRMHVVHVRGYLVTEENIKSAALSTGYGSVPKVCSWRAICSAFRPDTIAGWGSLEQLELQANTCADYGVAVYALHVSTRYLQSGMWIKKSAPVADVLFVQETAPGLSSYRRLGVGRISDRDLIAEFEEAEDREIHLV